jgi:hypothetical protein
MPYPKLALATSVILVLIIGPGCHTKGTVGPDAAPDAPAEDAPAEDAPAEGPVDLGQATPLPEPPADATPPGMPPGSACESATECASHVCVDSVCCISACASPCYACNQPVARGTCLPIYGTVDEVAIPSCTGIRTCSVDSASTPSCALVDGQECSRDTDCSSRHCRTYYLDHDNDGYGAAAGSIQRCDATPNPPAPYIALGGDCCDTDPGANPLLPATSFLPTADACGSFDWNCSGMPEKEPLTCFLSPALACGQKCIGPFGNVVFTQACH